MLLHPAVPLFTTALVIPLLRGKIRTVAVVLGGCLSLIATAALKPGMSWSVNVASMHLTPLKVDELSWLFGIIFALVALLGTIYSMHTHSATEHAAAVTYAGSALGLTFAGDWITAFAFWELMALASLAIIWSGGQPGSRTAGFRYLFVHALGGSLFFAGITIHLSSGGGLAIAPLTSATTSQWAYGLILTAVLINAAVPPLHAWLTDAYPEASVSGMVFLSAFTTKGAVYLLIRVFPGSELLVLAGVVMALYGVVYAVLENDIRRLLAYHIISQVGYMVAAVGIGTNLALNGAAAHAFCHILYKALLLMGAGAVIASTGQRRLTELGGLAKFMPLVVILYTVGAFSISGVPLFNGFISKAMVLSAAEIDGRSAIALLLTLASIGTFLHTGLKLPYFTFFTPKHQISVKKLPVNMLLAMFITAGLCLFLGLYPEWLYTHLPMQPVLYEPYTMNHVVSTLQLLVGTTVGFWLLRSKVGGAPTYSLDVDVLYRKPTAFLMNSFVTSTKEMGRLNQQAATYILQKLNGLAGVGPTSVPVYLERNLQPLNIIALLVLLLLVVLSLL